MKPDFLLYGSYGYTGNLIAEQAVLRGMQPLLAGRDRGKLTEQASKLGVDYRAFSLDDQDMIDQALGETPLVLNCAGPYTFTAGQVVNACLRTGAHYLDLNGEIAVYTAIQEKDNQAKEAGVMLLPGVGFDVASTDCLALHLKQRLPGATHLALAFTSRGGSRPSRGTLRSAVEMLEKGLLVRQDGQVMRAPNPGKTRSIDLGTGPVKVHLFSWGDVFTAYYSTGIPNIEVYTSIPAKVGWLLPIGHRLSALFTLDSVKYLLRGYIENLPPGPTSEQRLRTRTYVWGEVRDEQGRVEIARMQGPEAGYSWTVDIALQAVKKTLAGGASPGYLTPGSAFGADFILECGGERQDDDSLV
jgi:short subunit dehydrogenase-like uncharacterized protein